jgi:carboxypeptidase D
MIGNGWIDPINQYLAYPEFAFKVGLVNPSSKAADLVNEELKKCTEWIDSNHTAPIHIEACEGILSAITDSTVQTYASPLLHSFALSSPYYPSSTTTDVIFSWKHLPG